MKFIKKYWYLLFIAVVTAGLGVVTFLTSQKLTQTQPVAPTVPQEKPKAVEPACRLTFTIAAPSVTPTPTSAPNTLPECTGLSISPATGRKPLNVTFTCSGIDRDGDITAADFDFGDGNTKREEKNVGSPGSLSATYTYEESGIFDVTCKVRDNNVVFSSIPDACKKTVTVRDATVVYQPPRGGTQTQEPTATPTPRPTATPTPFVFTSDMSTETPTSEPSPSPTPIPTPKVPVAGSGPGVLGATTIAGGILLLLLGLLF